jgi:hypothetical protein
MLEVMANMKKKCAFVSAAYLPPKHATVAGFVMVNIAISEKLTEDAKTNRDLIGNVDDLSEWGDDREQPMLALLFLTLPLRSLTFLYSRTRVDRAEGSSGCRIA